MTSSNCIIKNKIHTLYPSFTKSEQKVAQTVLQKGTELIYFSITELASSIAVGEATVLRFCRKLGFSGYQEFKLALAKEASEVVTPVEGEDPIQLRLNHIFETLHDSMNMLDCGVLQQAADILRSARFVYIFGIGLSGVTALDVQYRLWMLKKSANAVTDPRVQPVIADSLTAKDTVIIISVSGNEKELVQAIQIAKRNGAKVIAITHYVVSPVTELADYVLFTTGKQNSTDTKLSQLFVLDCLCNEIIVDKKESSVSAAYR